MNKWDAKFGFFWYNDDEIFRFSQEDFDRKAKTYADAGINIVITFSCTHFRWSMYEHWDVITECLKKMVIACHKYDIKLVEHHSVHLTFDPLNDEEWDYFDRVLTKRHSSIDSWSNIRNFVTDNFTREFRQIDGRTGEFARSSYKGYCMCYNNEKYRKAYFDYLEHLYKETEIDGIMADDVQYFGEWQACTCSYCRALFKEQTGYDIPEPDQWESFYGDYDNKVYVAWEKFRRSSTERFQRDINRHFEGLGLHLLRPNYISSTRGTNYTAYPFDACGDLWDWVFQENCYSSIIRYSWLDWYTEAVHRYAMGRKNGVPSMSMFYPDRYDSYYFTWSLAQFFGQLGLFTPEGKDMTDVEKVFRDFEKKHRNILQNQQKHSDFAFYFPFDSWQFTDPKKNQSYKMFRAYSQGAMLNGLIPDLVYEDEDFMQFETIVLLDVRMMKEATMTKFNQYVKAGGNLIIFGIPGVKNEHGEYRELKDIDKAFMIDTSKEVDGNDTNLGDIYFSRQTPFYDDFYDTYNADRWARLETRTEKPKLITSLMAKNQGDMLRALLPENLCAVKSKNTDELVLTHAYISADGSHFIIHILNANDTLNTDKNDIGHNDIIKNFMKDSKNKNDEIKIDIIDYPEFVEGSGKFISPELELEVPVLWKRKEDCVEVTVPENTFSGYGIITIEMRRSV
ncbi:MAG: beta-galactosidase trimerization domain-containing protein [Clostridia bacterium]|nr:beta-galactosidase trimerization domain-containing protein [Clostridia bacterium]